METQPTYCFCGCGNRVQHPRQIVTNTAGWELNTELVEWLKLEVRRAEGFGLRGGFPSEEFCKAGRSHWIALSDAIHAGQRVHPDDGALAVKWAKISRKARRKKGRRWRRGGSDVFALPDTELGELREWIVEGRLPEWARSFVTDE